MGSVVIHRCWIPCFFNKIRICESFGQVALFDLIFNKLGLNFRLVEVKMVKKTDLFEKIFIF